MTESYNIDEINNIAGIFHNIELDIYKKNKTKLIKKQISSVLGMLLGILYGGYYGNLLNSFLVTIIFVFIFTNLIETIYDVFEIPDFCCLPEYKIIKDRKIISKLNKFLPKNLDLNEINNSYYFSKKILMFFELDQK